jgi:hypothetical protein
MSDTPKPIKPQPQNNMKPANQTQNQPVRPISPEYHGMTVENAWYLASAPRFDDGADYRSAASVLQARLGVLADLCRRVDVEKWLLDVQCQDDEDLVNEWKSAWDSLPNVSDHRCWTEASATNKKD